MPVILTPSAEGYYAKHVKMQNRAGIKNLACYSNLDSDSPTNDPVENQDNLQLAMDEADRYVDSRARVLGLTADTSATMPRMIGTDNVYYSRISDLASDIAVAFIYSARGFTGDQSNTVEGQMADMDKKAREELDEIFGRIASDDDDDGNDPGMFVSVGMRFGPSCGVCDENGCE